MAERGSMGTIKSILVSSNNESSVYHCVGESFVDEIKKEQLVIDGDKFDHYVVYCHGHVVATVRASHVTSVRFTNQL